MQKEKIIKLLTGASTEDASKYIPNPLNLWVKQVGDSLGEIPFFVSESSEGEVTGFCIFMTYKSGPSTAYLLYVDVKEKYRRLGYGSALIKKGCEYLKSLGYSSVEYIVPPEIKDLSILKKQGFFEEREEIYVTYKISSLKKSKINENIDKLRPLINKVKSLSETPKDVVTRFKDLQKRKHRYIDITKFDPYLTEVFVDKGQILGYMAFSLYESKIITQIDLYISGEKEAKYAYPAILGEVIERSFSEDSDDFMICLYVNDIPKYQALKELLGEPYEENRSGVLTLKL